ncbi:proline iminopeptidase [Lentinula guzmanii]|uniref:Proline iminopeptidase n=1 Tax=Lentinula guzmanii TaxID=2804957 RepID=A0AA38MQU1_9AGAR|nr:proline iminopeptidase [Lentinula guzmanii]
MYPDIQPYETSTLKVSDIHILYYELSGVKTGRLVLTCLYEILWLMTLTTSPVVFVHGGPGGGCDEKDRSFFNPHKYKICGCEMASISQIILFDQRGSGKSTPTIDSSSACLEDNTTWDLVKDMEKLREKLNIETWHIFGGSWVVSSGSCKKPDIERYFHAKEKDLSELHFFYQDGASHLFPEAWDEYLAPIPEAERHDMILAYHAQLNSIDDSTRVQAAKAWSKWEMSTSKLYVDPSYIHRAESDVFANTLSAFARIENHYFINSGFMRDGQLLEKQEIDKMYASFIRPSPPYSRIVVQGRYDVVCPATTAYSLKKVWPEMELHIVPDAGHSSREVGIAKLLVDATNKFANLQ